MGSFLAYLYPGQWYDGGKQSPFGFTTARCAEYGSCAKIMKIEEEEVQKVEAAKKEQGSPATTEPGEEETRRQEEAARPGKNEEASASSERVLTEEIKGEAPEVPGKLRLPPWSESGGKKRSRMDRSPTETPVHDEEEERCAEDVAKKHEEKEEAADKRMRRGKDAESAGCGEMLTYTDSMFDELVMETQRFEQKYKGDNNPTSIENKVQGCTGIVHNVPNECVEVPSTPTHCSGLSTPIQQQMESLGQGIGKAVISPLSQGSRRKRRRESREEEEKERLAEERVCQRAREICRSEKDTEPKSTILKKVEEIGNTFEKNFFEWHLLAVRLEQLKYNISPLEEGKLPPDVKPFQPHRRQMRDFQEKWQKSLDKDITLSLNIERGATLLEVNQAVQAFQEQIYMDCQKQALTWTMSKLKAACSAESVTNEIMHIEYEEPFETDMYREARKKATLEIGEKEMMYTRWKVREVLQSKLLSNDQKESEELEFRRQIYDLKDPKKAMEWLYEKIEGELPQAVEHATKKTKEEMEEFQDQNQFIPKWKYDNASKSTFNAALGTQIGMSWALLGYSSPTGESYFDPQDKSAGKGKGKGAKSKGRKGKRKGAGKDSKSSEVPTSKDFGREETAKNEGEKEDTPGGWDSGRQSTHPKGKKWEKTNWDKSWEDSEWDAGGKWPENKVQEDKKQWPGKKGQDTNPSTTAQDKAESWEWAKQDWGAEKKKPPPPPSAPSHSYSKRGRYGGTY